MSPTAWKDMTVEQKERLNVWRRNDRKKNPEKYKKYDRGRNRKWPDEKKEMYRENKNKARRTPEFRQKRTLSRDYYKEKYGITTACRNDMAKAQNYKCAICGKHESDCHNKKLYVDHDHETGKVRALLCNRCNKFLGFVEKDIEVLTLMRLYINKHLEE